MWIGPSGQRIESPLQNPQPLHGGQSPTGLLQYVEIEGKRLNVVRHGLRFVVFDEGSLGICGEARCYELETGAFMWGVRNLVSGKWTGERVEDVTRFTD